MYAYIMLLVVLYYLFLLHVTVPITSTVTKSEEHRLEPEASIP